MFVCMCVHVYHTYLYMSVRLIVVNCHISLISTVLSDKVATRHILQLRLVIWKQHPKLVLRPCSSHLKKWGWIVHGDLDHDHISQ